MAKKQRKDLYIPASGQRIKEGLRESQFSKYQTGKNGRTGHGFAAEDANALADKLSGKNVDKVGANNAKNGADRITNGIKIQSKYCQTARETINAAFDSQTGMYRYRLRNGRPMKLEVPRDQYAECVRRMRKLIEDGKVPGVKNPNHATKMVKKGLVTYKQSLKLAKAGNIPSLVYDVASGMVTSSSAAGISAVISYFMAKSNGAENKEALKIAAKDGAWTGGSVMTAHVIVSQCTKKATEIAAKKASESAAKTVASKVGTAIVKTGAKANVVTAVITTAVISRNDIKKAIKREMSVTECAENVGVNLASVTAGLAGAAKGAAIGSVGGPVGSFFGGLIGGVACGIAGEQGLKTVVKKFKRKRKRTR